MSEFDFVTMMKDMITSLIEFLIGWISMALESSSSRF